MHACNHFAGWQLAPERLDDDDVDARRRDTSKSMNFGPCFDFVLIDRRSDNNKATTLHAIPIVLLWMEFLWLSRIDFAVSCAAWHRPEQRLSGSARIIDPRQWQP